MANSKTILTAGPSITNREVEYVLDAVQHGWNENWSGYLERFEQSFAEYVGTRFAISTSSCTGALHLALLALGVKPGDEVLVPDVTWVATASAVAYCGATPVAVDVEPDTWCLDVERRVVRLHRGQRSLCPFICTAIRPTCRQSSIWPTSMGCECSKTLRPHWCDDRRAQGRQLGRRRHVQFPRRKIMTTGEGGMLVTNDEETYQRARHLADHGRDPHRPFFINTLGYKYKLSNLQAALGLAQLERIEELIARKRLIFQWYRSRLQSVPGVQLNVERPTRAMSIG